MKYESFHVVSDRLTDPVLLLDRDGCVLAVNPAASRALSSELLGAELADLLAEPDKFRRFLTFASGSSSPLPGAVKFVGEPVSWRGTASSAQFGDHRLTVLWLRPTEVVVRRFTALNQQIEQLQLEIRRREDLERERELLIRSEREARNAAEEASRFKDELLAAVSHELRTPLNAIAGWVSLIRANPDDRDRLQRGLDVIQRNVAAEVKLTEDLVDTSLILGGRMKLEMETVDFREIVRAGFEGVIPAAEAKQQRVEVRCEDAACIVNGDEQRLLQIVANLASNAVKYTSVGGRIEVEVRRNESHVELSVQDDGEGIDPETIPFVFDRFRRADGSTTRRHGGLGLGLGIVRGLVELHGGVVMAESDGPGRGSTFTVSLPSPAFRTLDVAMPDLEALAGSASSLAGLHLLLVEDHDDSREMLSNILSAQGATVDAVASSADAQLVLQEQSPDAVISDIEMPGEDGFTMMRKWRVREEQLNRDPVPAIAISAHTISDARLHALRAGFQAYLTKPLQPAELIATILSLCHRRRAQ